MYTESKNEELKREFSKESTLKTICAYANYHDGVIYIGVGDDGKTIFPIPNIDEERLRIENIINTSITPRPFFNITKEENGQILKISVSKGKDGPYYCENKTYMRQDTSTVAVDGANLTRLILRFKNLSFDEIEIQNEDLDFEYLKSELASVLGISNISNQVFITLGLMKNGKYNNGALLLADNGEVKQSYIDIARFGLDTNSFGDELQLKDQSLLKQYNDAYIYFTGMYQPYQVIEGMRRVTKYPIPIEAFREALANAVVHRDYLYKSGVQIAMFDNRIEIRSPGGLPEGVTEEMYYANLSSEPRNPILADVFKRLGIVEKWGTGVKKIIDNYKKENSHPSFKIEQTQITVILPVLNYDYTLLETNRAIMAYLGAFPNSPRSDIEEALKIEKTTLIRKLNELLKDGEIISNGRGPTVTYNIK